MAVKAGSAKKQYRKFFTITVVFHQDLVLKINNLGHYANGFRGNKMKIHTADELRAMSVEEATRYFDRLHKNQAKTQVQGK